MFKEEASSDLSCDTIFIWCQNGHLREPIENQKDIITTMLGAGKTSHVIHGDQLPGFVWDRERSVQPLLLDGWFSNDIETT